MTRPSAISLRILRLAVAAAALGAPVTAAPAQVPDSAFTRPDSLRPGRTLRVTSEPAGAAVYRDSMLLGTTPLAVPVGGGPAGTAGEIVRLRIFAGDPGSWFVPVMSDTIVLPAIPQPESGGGETLSRHYVLPLAVRITSDPPGAGVVLGDSLIGTTPLYASIPGPDGSVTIRMDGFRPQTIMLGPGTPRFHAVLVPDGPQAAAVPSPLAEVSGKSRTMLFLASGTAVVTGAAAAWLKNRADNYYGEYQARGDPATLDRVRRYDILSGIALSVAEISLGYLIIELLSR